MKYTAVIFDLDDTLCNTSDVLEKSIQTVYEKYLDHFPGKTSAEILHIANAAFDKYYNDHEIPIPTVQILTLHSIFESLGISPKPSIINKLQYDIWDEIAVKLKLKKGAYDLLEYLHQSDIKTGILTNGPFREQAQKVDILGIERFCDYMVTPDMVGVDKPDTKMFDYILKKLACKPSDSLMVGDNFIADIVGAKRFGMDAVYIDSKNDKKTDTVTPDLIVNNLKQVHDWLRKTG